MSLQSVAGVAVRAAGWVYEFPLRFERGLRREAHAHDPLRTEAHSERGLGPRAEGAAEGRMVAGGVAIITGGDSARAAEFEETVGHGVEVRGVVVHCAENAVRPRGVRAGHAARTRAGAVVEKTVALNGSAQAHDGGEHAKC